MQFTSSLLRRRVRSLIDGLENVGEALHCCSVSLQNIHRRLVGCFKIHAHMLPFYHEVNVRAQHLELLDLQFQCIAN